jgi:hypothetical protein
MLSRTRAGMQRRDRDPSATNRLVTQSPGQGLTRNEVAERGTGPSERIPTASSIRRVMRLWTRTVLALIGLAAMVSTSGCSLSGGSGPAGVEAAQPVRSTAMHDAAFPLAVSHNGRYLVDHDNRPFLIVGDSPQALVVNVSVKQANYFLSNRKAAGFNAVWVNLLSDDYTGGRPDGSTYDGIHPFDRQGNLSTPNDSYFARADAMLRLAAKYRMAVFLDPIETGGWLKVLRNNGLSKAYAFGRYLGSRYKSFPNIVWMSGNDFQTWRTPSDDALALAVARGIKATDPGHLQTVELDYRDSGSLEDANWRGLISLDAAYTYLPTFTRVLKEYNREERTPVFMVEANYEGEHDYTGPMTLRRQEYWTMLSGATGQFYGNKYTWQFLDGWQALLSTIGSRQMTYVTNLFVHHRWFDLVPDDNHSVVVSGYGSYAPHGTVQDANYVTAARTPDGRLVMAYVPEAQTIGVDMSRLAGRVLASWYDPTNGTYQRVRGSRFDNAGTREFSPPGKNADGDPDWVLVLTAS